MRIFNFTFTFDRVSFWLGFLAATLLWWLWSRVRPMLPMWRDQLRQYMDAVSLRNLSGVDQYLRRETLRRAQRQHLAGSLFALDEVLIEPSLLVPPSGEDPQAAQAYQPMAAQVIPYLPDWPELVAPFGVPTLSPAQALQSERNLVFIGQPGCGKTVALAHLASQLARGDSLLGKYSTACPLFLHAVELETQLPEGQDPLQNLIRSVSRSASAVMQPQIPRFLQSIFRDRQSKTVLLLDGLDELNQETLTSTLAYLKALLKSQPRLQVIAAASSDHLDGLTRAGFYPLGISAWTQSQREELTHKWGALWTEQLLPEARKHANATLGEIDPVLINLWLDNEATYATPLEWTLRVWGAYAGDLSGSNNLGILDTFISRFLPNPAYVTAIEELAHQMVRKVTTCLSLDEMEKILSAVKLAEPVALDFAEIAANVAPAGPIPRTSGMPTGAPVSEAEQAAGAAEGKAAKKTTKKARRDVMTTQGEQIIDALIQGGVLIQHSNHMIRFASPVFLALLGGMRITPEEADTVAKGIAQKIDWPVHLLVLQYAVACSDNPNWVAPLIEDQTPPLYRGLMIAARWLRDAPPDAPWRAQIMRRLVSLVQDETLPLGIRARLIAAFYLSRDPSIPKLFKQLLCAQHGTTRRAALLGCGALGNVQLINDVLALLADPESEVRYTACLALAAIPSEPSLNAVVQVMLSGDEEIRQAAAESLALNHKEGYEILKEAAVEDDLLTRRAAVFGLQQVREPWAQETLEKLAVQDGQWVVRNAAGQALEALQQTLPAIPKPLPRPSDSAWLLTFASKMGLGLTPGQPATDVLLTVLKSGTVEEQIAALYYLRDHPDEGVFGAIYGLFYSGVTELYEPTIYTLWWMAVSGNKLPHPTQFGLS